MRGLDQAYAVLKEAGTPPKLLLATYFEAVDNHAARLKNLPVNGLHIDLCRAPDQLDTFLDGYPAGKVLSLGIIDGRNVWRADLAQAFSILSRAQSILGERLWVAPSCSLLHCPVDLELETRLDEEIKSWLAFSAQKLSEVSTLGRGLNEGEDAIRRDIGCLCQGRQAARRIATNTQAGDAGAPAAADAG